VSAAAEEIFEEPTITIAPQPGPQTQFLETTADIAIFGGAAGGGKTFSLLMEPLRHVMNPRFSGLIFRRSSVQIRNIGGLWTESTQLYPMLGGEPRTAMLDWTFPNPIDPELGGMIMKFAYLERDADVYNFQGAQTPYIAFDELTHFSEFQFFYMLSRLRSTSGVRGYVRATTNPDADSWIRQFIDWWIDEDGFAIPDRSGVIRWFIRMNDETLWGDSAEELQMLYGSEQIPKSFTFIAAKLSDNKILMEKDPSYLGSLMTLPQVERERLLGDKVKGGNWNTRITAGTLFNRKWFTVIDTIPDGWVECIRFWDRAATKPNPGNMDPDWTRGVKLYRYRDGTYVVGDVKSIRDTPGQVELFMKEVAEMDGRRVKIVAQQDPGSAGVSEAEYIVRRLGAFEIRVVTLSKDKVVRAKPVSAQCEFGNIKVLKAPWNQPFFSELISFPDGKHDDIVDGLSGAYNEMPNTVSTLDAYRAQKGKIHGKEKTRTPDHNTSANAEGPGSYS